MNEFISSLKPTSVALITYSQQLTSSSAMAETERSLLRFRRTFSVIRKITKLHLGASYKGNISALSRSFNAKKLL